MKNFSKFFLGFLGLVVLFMPNISPDDLVRQYGTVSHLLPFLGMMMILIAPSYPDNAKFLENFAPSRSNSLVTTLFFFVALTAFTMATNLGSLFYQSHVHNQAGITFFATSFAMNILIGGAICAVGIISLIVQQIRYTSAYY